MKADEFSNHAVKKTAMERPRVDKIKKIIADSERELNEEPAPVVGPVPAAPVPMVDEEEHNIYGANSTPGHEMHRIRKSRPHLWDKIKNWD